MREVVTGIRLSILSFRFLRNVMEWFLRDLCLSILSFRFGEELRPGRRLRVPALSILSFRFTYST